MVAPTKKRGRPKKVVAEQCPPLTSTLESVDAVNAWIVRETTAGRLGTTSAKEITAAVRTAVMSIRTREQIDELETLRAMLAEAKDVATERAKAAVESRYSGDEGRIGEFEVSDTPPGEN